eukprot:gene35871-58887_t
MAYVSQAQARLLESLRANLRAVEANQAGAQNARDELEEIAQEEQQQKELLVKEKAKRAAVLASLLFAVLLAWYFSRPIRSLRQAFEAASRGDLAPRFAHAAGKRGDELSGLGRDFDRMTARLRSLMDAQTRLLHDVSHELRSPLARLQAAIGLAHQQPEKAHATMERIERESVRMDKLVGELLTLARLESGPINQAREQI